MKNKIKLFILLFIVNLISFTFFQMIDITRAEEKKSYIFITNKKSEMQVKENYAFQIKIVGLEKTDIIWWVSDPNIAEINPHTGQIYAKEPGSLKITAKDRISGKTSSCNIEIIPINNTMALLNEINEIWCGVSYQFNLVNKYVKINWSVSDDTIAEITSDRILLGKKAGEIILYMEEENGNSKKELFIKVKDIEETPITAFEIEKTEEGIIYLIGMKDTSYTEIKIPSYYDGNIVSGLGEDVFNKLKEVRTLIIPSSIEFIEPSAFMSCVNLESIVFLDRKEHSDRIVSLDTSALNGIKLKEYVMPYQCKITLVMDSFRNASLIDYVAIPKYAAFDWGVFRFSENITIIMPEEMINLGPEIFSYCNNIIIVIPEHIINIDDNFIYECSNMKIITPKGSAAEEYAKANNIPYENY